MDSKSEQPAPIPDSEWAALLEALSSAAYGAGQEMFRLTAIRALRAAGLPHAAVIVGSLPQGGR